MERLYESKAIANDKAMQVSRPNLTQPASATVHHVMHSVSSCALSVGSMYVCLCV